MKKSHGAAMVAACLMFGCGFFGCTNSKSASASSKAKTVSVRSINVNAESVQVEVPENAKRVVVLDLAVLDILDNLGLGGAVVGSVTTRIDYLRKYADDPNILKCGTVNNVDFETILEAEPDVIFAGGRLQTVYDQLARLAPTVILLSATTDGLYETVKSNALEVAKIWGKEDDVAALTENFASRIAALKDKAAGKTAIVGMCTNGGFNVLGNNGRCSIIGNEIGFTNVGVEFAATQGRGASRGANTSMHGTEVSFEFVVRQNPDYIFVLDRDSAIGTAGAMLAADILDNELINETDAVKNGHLVIFANPAVWYTAEGGITAFDVMLQDLERAM